MTALFSTALASDAAQIEARAGVVLGGSDVLSEAMLYALKGGKMLRGFLVMEGARLHGVDSEAALDTGLAIECIHAYSLIHDDLPCMDDDDLRRGQPTVHRKWDEATAVLAGDALQALAFELLSDPRVGPGAMTLIASLAAASGRAGMVGGQMLDIAAESATAPLSVEDITQLQQKKTGALIHWAAQAGAVLGQADPAPLLAYGRALGLAFQIADDILDVEGDATEVGKAVRKDAQAGKATFVSLLGLDEAKRRAQSLVIEASDALSVYGTRGLTLRDAAQFVVSRRK